MSVSGTLGKFSFNNQVLRVANDVDVERKFKYAVEMQATSGDPNAVVEIQVPTAEGFVLVVDEAQRESFLTDVEAAIISGGADCSYTTRGGSNYTAKCMINITADTTREAKITVDASPTKAAGWTPTIV